MEIIRLCKTTMAENMTSGSFGAFIAKTVDYFFSISPLRAQTEQHCSSKEGGER